jgi:hypothetical protein
VLLLLSLTGERCSEKKEQNRKIYSDQKPDARE